MSFKSWMLENLDYSDVQNLHNHGAAGGISGLIYYSETVSLYEKFEDEIWEKLSEDTEEFGHENIFEFIASFKGAAQYMNGDKFKNMLVWYLAESYANEIIENKEMIEE